MRFKYNIKTVCDKKLLAFTLTEVLIVLVIIGILILLALPNLMPLISKAKSTEAQLQLEHVFTLEKSYFYLHSKYSSSFDDIDFEPAKSVKDGGSANYKIEITAATEKSFKAIATAVVDFDGDGVYDQWEIDQDKNLKEVTKD
jgi:type IV pilus assembly protein PilE